MKRLLLGLALLPCVGASQTLSFERNTDTVSIVGQVNLGTDCTFEAWFKPTSLAAMAKIWNEWEAARSDKVLAIAPGEVHAFAWPASPNAPFIGVANITLNQWHHLAYSKQGGTERIYMDGVLLNAGACGQNIGNGTNVITRLGAIYRDSVVFPGPLGELKSLRISNIARYTGGTYSLPPMDLATDANTEILYNFNDPIGSATLQDLSGHGHTGTLGVGHAGATAPVFKGTPVLPGSLSVIQGTTLGGGLAQVLEADGSYMFMQPPLNSSRQGAFVELLASGVSPWNQPGSLRIVLNVAAALPNFNLTTELKNQNTNQWDIVDQRAMPMNDTPISIAVTGNVGAYIAQGTNAVSMRVRVTAVGVPLTSAWTVRFDQMRWQASPPWP